MRRHRTPARRGARTAAIALAVGTTACLDPTQVLLEVSTDVKCDQLEETSITVGTLGELEDRPPVITTKRCDDNGWIGSTMIVPSGERNDEVAVRVVTALGSRTADDCVRLDDPTVVDQTNLTDCAFARRAIKYLEHTELRLVVEIERECVGVDCAPDETCFRGECVPARIPDSKDCTGDNVCLPLLPDGGFPDATGDITISDAATDDGNVMTTDGMPDVSMDAPVPDGGADASMDASMTTDTGLDSPADTGADGPIEGLDATVDTGVDAPSDAGGDVTAPEPPITQSNSWGATGAGSEAFDLAIAPASGNVSITGQKSSGNASFGGAPIGGTGARNVFVASYLEDGTHVWSNAFGTQFLNEGFGIAADSSGGTFVTGRYGGPIDFGGSALTPPAVAQYAIFVVKFDASGAHQWSHGTGSGAFTEGRGAAADGAGSSYFVGSFDGNVDFDPVGAGGDHSTAGSSDIFVASYDAAGNYRWSRRLGDVNADVGRAIAVDGANNVYVTGLFRGTIDFGGGGKTSNGANADVFVVSYDSAGNHRWSERYGGAGNDNGRGIAARGTRVAVTGQFETAITFGASPVTTNGAEDGFVAAFATSNGAPQWAAGQGGAGVDWTDAVTIDAAGNVYTTGRIVGTADFGGGPRAAPAAGSDDMFLASYAASGGHRWSQAYGGMMSDWGEGVGAIASGGLFWAGHIQGAVDLGAGPIGGGTTFSTFLARVAP